MTSLRSEGLVACPFCGGEAHASVYRLAAWTTPSYYAGCKPCDMYFHRDTVEQAVAAWNRRALTLPPLEADVGMDAARARRDAFIHGYKEGAYDYTDHKLDGEQLFNDAVMSFEHAENTAAIAAQKEPK